MANYSTLKAAINAVIKTNGQKEITGEVLNQVLNAMVTSLGSNYQFAGVATPGTNPGTPDQNVFYMATEAGTYTNFNATVLPAGISILLWNGSWSHETFFEIDSVPTSGSDNLVSSGAVFEKMKLDGGAYDVSAHNGGATFVSLSALLNIENLNTLIPVAVRHGGMSIKFVQSSDNKYVQYRLMADTFSTTESDWQGVDKEPTSESQNLITSGGVEKYIPITHKSFSNIDSRGNYICFVRDIPAGTTLKLKVTGSAEWNRLWISSNDNLGARLQDEVVKGTSYTITTASDITNIGLYVYTLTSSGTLRLDMEITKTKTENDIIAQITAETTRAQGAETNIANNVTALRTDVDLIGNKISIDQTGWNKNKCIKSNGELNTSDPGYAYIKIPVLKGDSIKASSNLGFPASRAVIALTDENESYYNVVLVGNDGNNYNYTSTENGYICVCVRFGNDETILSTAVEQIRIANSNAIEDNTNVIKDISEPSKNLFDINTLTGEEGKYKGYISGSGAQHTYISNNSYNLSPYIEVEEGATYVGQINGSQHQFRFVYFYTNKGVANIIDSQTISSQVWSVTVNSGYNIKYARFCIALDSASDEWNPTIMIQKGTEITPFEHYGSFIKNDALHKPYIEGIARIEATKVRNFGLSGSLKDSANALAVSTNFTLSSLWVHNFLVTSARIKGVISNVLVGVGYNVRYGGWIELTQTQAIVHFYYGSDLTVQTENHGLTLGEDTMVSIFSNEAAANKVHVVILSNGSQYEFNVTYDWNLGGTPFVRNSNSSGTLDVELSATPQKITKQIWLFGDSYTYPYADRTWTKWLYQWNGNKDPWLASQQPGATSAIIYATLESLISTGAKPKFIVWALGMNDGSDTNEDTPNTNWLTYVNNLVALCEQNNITPIFVTIPNVPTINHEGKNKWIKDSGYRYIDLAKAVGAETYTSGVRNWYGEGEDYAYLASDGIHATAFGGRAMASQVLQDFSEIICEN